MLNAQGVLKVLGGCLEGLRSCQKMYLEIWISQHYFPIETAEGFRYNFCPALTKLSLDLHVKKCMCVCMSGVLCISGLFL